MKEDHYLNHQKIFHVKIQFIYLVNINNDKDREKANEVALKDFYDKVLVPCQWCGRTFLEDRLAIHNKSCTQEHPAKRITDGAKPREGTKVFGEFHPNTGSDPSPTPPKSTSSAHNSVSGIKPVKTKITKPETTNAFATPTNESTVQKRASSPSSIIINI